MYYIQHKAKPMITVDELIANCTEILSIYKDVAKLKNSRGYNFVLWRGLGKDRGEILKSIPHNIEITKKDICKTIRNFVDKPLVDLNHKSTRSNCIMTSSKNIAKNYGVPYAIFPKDGFDYTWFKKQERSYILFHIEEIIEECLTEHNIYGDLWDEEFYKTLHPTILERIEKSLSDMTISLQPEKSNLSEGLMLENEFYINCDSYYSIREDVLDSYLEKII